MSLNINAERDLAISAYEAELKKLRTIFSAEALSESTLVSSDAAKLPALIKARESFVSSEALLAEKSLQTAGAVPYELAWGSCKSGLADIIAE